MLTFFIYLYISKLIECAPKCSVCKDEFDECLACKGTNRLTRWDGCECAVK